MAESQEKDSQENRPAPKRERPSERMFKRSMAAERRRRQAEQKDANFMRMVFGIAGVTTLIVFMIVYMLSAGM
ncbi:MAG: hypothetical protein EX271_04085 [Acidimicrobiales bacterium]|nr:hypothetical protein [Hyphomonadaceae bacterium]RZV43308.1 MAG: hypothetical protein EX271_04085 [Acidimicrobiales bacterium]